MCYKLQLYGWESFSINLFKSEQCTYMWEEKNKIEKWLERIIMLVLQ